MRREHWYILGAIALGLVVVGLVFWLFGSIAAFVSLALGGATAKQTFDKYIKTDTDDHKRQADIEQKRQADIAGINQQEQQLLSAEKQHQQVEEQKIQKIVDGVETKSDINAEVDKALDQSEQFIRENGGFVGFKMLVAIVVMAVTYFCIVLPVDAVTITGKDKARLKRLLTNLKNLQSIIRTNKIKHKKALERQKTNHDATVVRLQSRIRALEQKLAIVANKPPPPTWPFLLAGAAAGALIVGGIWAGTVIGERGKSP